jgi:DNA-binding transcriptional LysR family regulator
MTVGGNELLKALVRVGAGLGCLSAAAVADEARRGELSIVPTESFVMGRILRIVTRIGRKPDAAVSAFLSVCEQSRDIVPKA